MATARHYARMTPAGLQRPLIRSEDVSASSIRGFVAWVRRWFSCFYTPNCASASMSTVELSRTVGSWRYVVRSDGDGMLVIARQAVPDDILEDALAFCYSGEVAEVIVEAIVAHERRKRSENSRS